MASYLIKTEDATPVTCGGVPTKMIMKHTKAAAWRAYEDAVYAAIKAQAGLDTQWGVDANEKLLHQAGESRECFIVAKQFKVSFKRLD